MPWVRPTLQEISSRIEADMTSRLLGGQKPLRRSVVTVLSRIKAGAIHGLYGHIAWSVGQRFTESAEAEYLERDARPYGLLRKAAGYASGQVTLTGTTGAIVPAGAELQRSDGVLYKTLGDASIEAGAATVQVEALDAGADGNTDAGVSLSFTSPVAGVQSSAIVASGGIAGGVDTEADSGLRSRVRERKRNPPRGGNADDYEAWATEISGVTRAWCYPLYAGPGTVGVTFVMDNQPGTIIPPQDKIDEVQAYIESKMPVLVKELHVFAPLEVPIDFEIAVSPNTAAVQAAVQTELAALLARFNTPGGGVYLSQINEAISIAPGETDHVLISPVANVALSIGQIPVLGTITWS